MNQMIQFIKSLKLIIKIKIKIINKVKIINKKLTNCLNNNNNKVIQSYNLYNCLIIYLRYLIIISRHTRHTMLDVLNLIKTSDWKLWYEIMESLYVDDRDLKLKKLKNYWNCDY